MFCPICGNKIDPTQKFCDSCGTPVNSPQSDTVQPDDVMSDPYSGAAAPVNDNMQGSPSAGAEPYSSPEQSFGAMPPQEIPQQNAFGAMPGQEMPQQNAFGSMPGQEMPQQNSFGSMPGQDMPPQGGYSNMPPQSHPVVYSGTMPITNGTIPDGGAAAGKPGGKKKAIIITLIIILLIVAGIVGFFLIKKVIAHQYIVNNPTKSALASYQVFVDENEKDNPLYEVFKDVKQKGNVKVTASGSMNPGNGEAKNFSANASLGYDVKGCNYYLSLDASELFRMSTGADETNGKAMIELQANPDNIYFNFDLAGKSGKYYVDNKSFRSDIANSIFAPDKDNIFGWDKETYDNFVDSYEKIIREFENAAKDDPSQSNVMNTYDKLIKSLEKNGNVKVESEKTELKDGAVSQTVNTDVVVYTFNRQTFRAFVQDMKEDFVTYIKETIGEDKSAEAIQGINKSFDGFFDSYDRTANDKLSLVVKVYLDADTHAAVKTTIDLKNATDDPENNLHAVFQFFKAPDNLITAHFTVNTTGGHTNTTSFKLKKTDDGTTIKYAANIEYNNDGTADSASGSFEYNRSTKSFTIAGNTASTQSSFSYTGKAEISGNKLSITLPDIVKTEQMTLSLTAEYSADAPAKIDVGDAKNILKLSADEFKQIFENAGGVMSLAGGGTGSIGGGLDDAYNPGAYSEMADASTMNNALKSVYAGVISGTITSNDIPSAPKAGASASERKNAANALTVHDALEYNNLTSLEDNIYSFGAAADGTVYAYSDTEHINDITQYITPQTKLGDIFKMF